jgi:hypothetical protein
VGKKQFHDVTIAIEGSKMNRKRSFLNERVKERNKGKEYIYLYNGYMHVKRLETFYKEEAKYAEIVG